MIPRHLICRRRVSRTYPRIRQTESLLLKRQPHHVTPFRSIKKAAAPPG
nr:MAG TPA: hypothetical protein [Caudoviricetes sp.]